METNNTGFLPSGTHSLVGKVDQYAKQSRKVICRVTGMCKSLALPENVEKADLEDGLRMPGGWKRLELAKELCLRTMARLRGFQSREWKLKRAMWTIQFSACSWDSSLSREEFFLLPNSENPCIFVSGSTNTVYRPQIRRLTFTFPGQTWEDISCCFLLHRLLMKAVASLILYGVKLPWENERGW